MEILSMIILFTAFIYLVLIKCVPTFQLTNNDNNVYVIKHAGDPVGIVVDGLTVSSQDRAHKKYPSIELDALLLIASFEVSLPSH
ncbi:unnamed protein product [Cunninghamella blakesleeana]